MDSTRDLSRRQFAGLGAIGGGALALGVGGGAAAATPPSPSDAAAPRRSVTDMTRMYGTGYPIVMPLLEAGGPDPVLPERTLYLIEAVGFSAIREWMHVPLLLTDPKTPNRKNVALFRKAVDRYTRLGLEITGMSHRWFLANADGSYAASGAMYPRDPDPAGPYVRTLEALATSWETIARLFPEVLQWEIGNEMNLDTFMHPIGWKEGKPGFSFPEKVAIATDMVYYARRGVKAGNPRANVVLFAPSVGMPGNLGMPGLDDYGTQFCPPSYSIALTLTAVYKYIKSGHAPTGGKSTNPDDYFDIVAWHPYLLTQGQMPYLVADTYPGRGRYCHSEEMDTAWRLVNDTAYNVMCMNGDADKKVMLTEMAFSDANDPQREAKQAAMLAQMFEMIRTSMPYIKTVHHFGMYVTGKGDGTGGGGPVAEDYWGLFWGANRNYAPRDKARVMQRLAGGKLPLTLPARLNSASDA